MLLEHRLSALLQPHLHSRLNIWLQGFRQRQPQDSMRTFQVLGFGASYIRDLTQQQQISKHIVLFRHSWWFTHYDDVIMGPIASQITSLTVVYSIVCSDADQRKHQSSAPLAFVRGIHRGPVNSLHKWAVTRKMFPFDDVIMTRSAVTLIGRRAHYICIDCCQRPLLLTFHFNPAMNKKSHPL